ncbi:heme utilization cystosolic carrier protein HutX [Methylobrevis albus]|uniref:Heme utilization cystosolic carrier protein HutX n=1 Tax=Methylobrevis albus TaxID=2793297 RepID=A0A931MZ94_9HYPH|nr:heme utilization cystosolic carrier protein HutX [Methylobrevis albus]MBH0237804.1 heme utilization cystosolic carrier protein HutX [Methylobrevis albus]
MEVATTTDAEPGTAAAASAALAAQPDGVVEAIARKAGVPSRTVLDLLPAGAAVRAPAEDFAAIWEDLAGWGEILFIVHTEDIVLECAGTLPVGSFGHGYYNIHGDSPIGGHIKADRCAAIYFVDRQFHGKRSLSVQFLNGDGEAMFKVFVRRDAARALLPDQVDRFEALRRRWQAGN